MTKSDRIWSMLFLLSAANSNNRDTFFNEISKTGTLKEQYNQHYEKAVQDEDCTLDTNVRKNAWLLGLRGSKPINYGKDPEYDYIYDVALSFREYVEKLLEFKSDLEIARLYKKMAVL